MHPGRPKETARLIQQSAINEQLLAALDHWAYVAHIRQNPDLCSRLLQVARLADPDPWRDQVRDQTLWKNSEALGKLADVLQTEQGAYARQSPQWLYLLSFYVQEAKKEPWLRKAQAIHPADFWLNFQLAFVLSKNKERGPEASGFYRVALAIRPKTPAVYYNLGIALYDQKDLPAAIDAFRNALAIDAKFEKAWIRLGAALQEQKDLPAAIDAYKKALDIDANDGQAWNNLGNALPDQKDLPAAIDAYKKALAIDAKVAMAWNNLGTALDESKALPAAIDAFKKALAIDAKYVNAWNNLGIAHAGRKDLPAAIEAYTKAIDIRPDDAEAHCNLGIALLDHGDFAVDLKALQKGHQLGTRQPGWPYPSAAWVKHCQQLLALEQRLPGVLRGEDTGAADLLALADLCH